MKGMTLDQIVKQINYDLTVEKNHGAQNDIIEAIHDIEDDCTKLFFSTLDKDGNEIECI